MSEVKLCPICGESAKIIYSSLIKHYWWEHECDGNIAIKSNEKYIYKESAIISWNTYCDLLDAYVEAMENG